MNLMFIIDGTLITPALSDTILDGVTRDSILQLARARSLKVQERKTSIRELEAALKSRDRVEAFGAGTAAVVAPIESIAIGDNIRIVESIKQDVGKFARLPFWSFF